MLELLIVLPNLYAAYTLSENNAYKTNLIYSFGYLPFIFYNVYIDSKVQVLYFLINWVLAVRGVMYFKKKEPTKQTYISPVNGCYHPTGNVDLNNPPQSGTGVLTRDKL